MSAMTTTTSSELNTMDNQENIKIQHRIAKMKMAEERRRRLQSENTKKPRPPVKRALFSE